jgi:hypothetical protein
MRAECWGWGEQRITTKVAECSGWGDVYVDESSHKSERTMHII